MTDLLPPPAILKTPTWYGGPDDETALIFPPEEYEVTHQGDRSTVRVVGTGEVIYEGIGPAQVVAPE